MFSSGSNTQDSGPNYPTQWALNPSAYQNLSNDQVDWAALAQQWIIMKETDPPSSSDHGPPQQAKKEKEPLNEGGEAPMDVENDKDTNDSWEDDSAPPSQDSWNWQQWGWNNSWNGPPGVPPPPNISTPSKTALLPTPFTTFAPPTIDSPPPNQNNVPPTDFANNFWPNSASSRNKTVKPRTRKTPEPRPEFSAETVTLDAAKRRQLPAWIREGLEKMEREKQKQMDRDREKREHEEYETKRKQEKKDAMKNLQASGVPEKSKFESDSESESEDTARTPSPKRVSPILTEEEKMEKMMIIVRRAMTEVLLQVTSIEIETICQEELNRFYSKHTASAKKGLQGTPSSGAVTGTLGLGIYGGSGSSSEDSDADAKNGSANDSDSKLKETIRKRRAEFAKTEREIETKLTEGKVPSGVPPGNGETSHRPDASTDSDNEDSQVDTALAHGKKSRTPPFKPSPEKPKAKPTKRKAKSSSSSPSKSDTSSSDSSDSDAHRRRRRSRNRSRSEESDRAKRRRRRRSRSSSSDSSSRRSRRRDDSRDRRDRGSQRRGSQRERTRRERSRSRHRRSRSRSRGRRSDRRRSRTRSPSRSRRYRSHRSRTRSRSDDRRTRRSPHGGGKKARGH